MELARFIEDMRVILSYPYWQVVFCLPIGFFILLAVNESVFKYTVHLRRRDGEEKVIVLFTKKRTIEVLALCRKYHVKILNCTSAVKELL